MQNHFRIHKKTITARQHEQDVNCEDFVFFCPEKIVYQIKTLKGLARQLRSRSHGAPVAMVLQCLYAKLVEITLQDYTGHSLTGNEEAS